MFWPILTAILIATFLVGMVFGSFFGVAIVGGFIAVLSVLAVAIVGGLALLAIGLANTDLL